MKHDFHFKVFHVESGDEMEVMTSGHKSARHAIDGAMGFVSMMNAEHRAGTLHTFEFHEGVPRTYRAEVYEDDDCILNVSDAGSLVSNN